MWRRRKVAWNEKSNQRPAFLPPSERRVVLFLDFWFLLDKIEPMKTAQELLEVELEKLVAKDAIFWEEQGKYQKKESLAQIVGALAKDEDDRDNDLNNEADEFYLED